MSDTFLRMLGFDFTRVPADAERSFTLTNRAQSWEVFVLLGAIALAAYIVLWLYRREIDTCPRPVRYLLAGIRMLVILILIGVLLGPAIAITQKRTVQPYVVVLIDDTVSMAHQDSYTDPDAAAGVATLTGTPEESVKASKPDRMSVIRTLLKKDDRALVRSLAEHGNLMIRKFSSDSSSSLQVPFIHKLADDETPEDETASLVSTPALVSEEEIDAFLEKTTGKGTNLAAALRDTLNATGTSRVAAIVVISDGQHNAADDDPIKALPAGVPVFTIGVGDPSEPRNLEVVRLLANDQVVKEDPFEIEATVRAIGLNAAKDIDVFLYRRKLDPAGNDTTSSAGADADDADSEDSTKWEEIARHQVHFPEGGGEQAVEPFKVTEKTAGQYAYRVSIVPLKDETEDSDNEKTANVSVLNDKARVLLISGGPSWDYRMVQTLLTNDDRFDLSCWLQSMDLKMQQKGNTPIQRLPIKPEELAEYHVIMLFDPNPEIDGAGALEFNEEWIDALSNWADVHGGGLLYVAGPQYTDRFLAKPETRSIQNLLPVDIADTDAIESRLVSSHARPWPLRIDPANADHAIMRFAGEGDNDLDIWSRMPGVYWSFPAESAKPGARVLIEHGDPNLQVGQHHRPLLVVNKLGAGRTVYLGFNGTWRWRRLYGAEYFRRFWIQLTKYLVEGRNLRGKNRVIVDVDRRSYDIGDTVNVFARLLKPNFEPLDSPKVLATIRGGKVLPPEEVELTMVEPGEYKGSITDIARVGINTLSMPLEGTNEKVETTFSVHLPAIEKKDLRLNQPLLEELANHSEGGKYYALNDAVEISSHIKDRSKTTLVPGKPVELWDTHVLLLLLAGLLSVEWIVRKRFKLA